jgi:penicillin-binding protein 2
LRVSGKTGTAQVVRGASRGGAGSPYKHRDNAFFVAYAPSHDPEIVVAVVAEHSGHGGSAAAPVAREVLAAYFGLEETPEGTRSAGAPAARGPEAMLSRDSRRIALQSQELTHD